jgi:hypothetical protein
MSSQNPPIQLQTQGQVAADKPALVIQFDEDRELEHLTPPSQTYLTRRLGEFGLLVLKEARSIEHTEHAGTGPPEITAAHIEEAWWVCRRRIRRSRHPILGAVTRVVQGLGIAGFGIGVGNLKAEWGMWLFVCATVITFLASLLEVHLQRME